MNERDRKAVLNLLFDIIDAAEFGKDYTNDRETFDCFYDISNIATAAAIILDTEDEQ